MTDYQEPWGRIIKSRGDCFLVNFLHFLQYQVGIARDSWIILMRISKPEMLCLQFPKRERKNEFMNMIQKQACFIGRGVQTNLNSTRNAYKQQLFLQDILWQELRFLAATPSPKIITQQVCIPHRPTGVTWFNSIANHPLSDRHSHK